MSEACASILMWFSYAVFGLEDYEPGRIRAVEIISSFVTE